MASIVGPNGHLFTPPSAPLFIAEVPPQAFRLAMQGNNFGALDLVFDYDNLSLHKLEHVNTFLFGVFETPNGLTRLPLTGEYWGEALQCLIDTIQNNTRAITSGV